MYSVTNYFLGKFLSTLPLDVFFPVLFSLVVYWMVGLNMTTASAFFLFLLAVLSITLCASSMGLLLGCMLPNAEVAVSIAPIALIPFMLFGGFFANLSSIGDWLSWIQYISIFKWGFQALVTNEFRGLTFDCTESQYVSVETPGGTVNVCPVTTGEKVLENLGYSFPNDYWIAIGVILGLFVFFRLLALFFLMWQTKRALKKTQT